MDMVTVPKRVLDLLAQVQKYGTIARASELQEVYRLIAAHSAGAQGDAVTVADSYLLGAVFGQRGISRDVANAAFYSGAPTVEVYIGQRFVFTTMAQFVDFEAHGMPTKPQPMTDSAGAQAAERSEDQNPNKPMRWYSVDEIRHRLKSMDYCDEIANELSTWLTTEMQLAFNKGFEKGRAPLEKGT